MKNKHLVILISVLTLSSLSIFLYKVKVLSFPLLPRENIESWSVEAEIRFNADDQPVKAILQIPGAQENYAILGENFVSSRYGRKTSRTGNQRRSTWSIRKASGRQILFYRAIITKRHTNMKETVDKTAKSKNKQFVGIHKNAINSIVEEIREKSADLDSFVSELLKRVDRYDSYENVAIFFGPNPTFGEKMALASSILNYAGYQARLLHGFPVTGDRRDVQMSTWLEVYDEGHWVSYNSHSGEPDSYEEYFIWWVGDRPLIKVKGAERATVKISVADLYVDAVRSLTDGDPKNRHPLVDFSLLCLPLRTQAVYKILLLIPIGVLILVVFRNVVGVKTFGTFMPVLIAIAFRETHLLWGVLLFTLLIALGLSVRFYLAKLQLLLVPRLASLLTVVVMIMLVISVLTQKLGFAGGLSIALFPMIIITMTIERMSIVWDERGPSEALTQGLGSLVIAVIVYLVMINDVVSHIMFVFPELLLCVLACTLALGRYSGFRLTELSRFKILTKEISDV